SRIWRWPRSTRASASARRRRNDMTDQPVDQAKPPRRRAEHFVNREPWDPYVSERLTAEQERYYMAGQWRLMWGRFRRHPPCVVSAVFLVLMYLSTLISEWIAPYDLHTRHSAYIFAPPQQVHLFHEGEFLGPFVYALKTTRDKETLQRIYTPDPTKPQKLRFFCLGDPYEFWGLIEGRFHFVCPPEGGRFFLLGTDRLGRDMFSRIVYPARLSSTIGIIGIVLSFALALVLGGLAGYYGGWVDTLIQRITEIIKSFPHLPLWLALSAALPVTWSPLLVYFRLTLILPLLDLPPLGPGIARLAGAGFGRAVQAPVPTRRGLRSCRANDGRQTRSHHRSALAARFHESSHCLSHAFHSLDDPGRDGAVLPRLGPAAAHHFLGRAPDRGHRHQCRGGELVVDVPGSARDLGDPRLPVHGRRHAGRRRSLRLSWVLSARPLNRKAIRSIPTGHAT